ncbi:MAG: phosphate ABC transporter substrate-binding protein [Pseudomonadota bacterium]
MKSTLFRYFSAVLLALLLPQLANAADVVVISHPGIAISAGDVKDVFLGEKQFAGGTKLIPVDNASLQDSFLSKFLDMARSKYSSAWTKKSFRDGLTPPAMKSGDAEVIDFVKRNPGAIGYVSSAPAGVNVAK